MERLKKLWQYKPLRVLIWQLIDVILAFGITYLSDITGEYQVLAVGLWIPILNILTKWINTTFLNDLGVEKE